MATVTVLSEQVPGWAPGTRHYSTSDGKHLAVEADPLPEGVVVPMNEAPLLHEIIVKVGGDNRQAVRYVARPTVVFLCDEHGAPIDADENDHDPLTPLHVFPAGTSHEEALTRAGYEVQQ